MAVTRRGDQSSPPVVLTMLIAAVLSPLISQGGAVAALVPVATLLALRVRQSPSKFLMPLAFASAAGSKLALTGTAKNVLISDAAADAGYGGFGFFEFAWVGIPLLAGTVVLVAMVGRRSCRIASPPTCRPTLASMHARSPGNMAWETAASSSASGMALRLWAPRATRSMPLQAEPDRGCGTFGGRPAAEALRGGDVLVLRGRPEALSGFAAANLLDPVPETDDSIADMLFSKHAGLAEVVVQAAFETRRTAHDAGQPHRKRPVRGGRDSAQWRGCGSRQHE